MSKKTAKLDALDVDTVCARIADGWTMREIAADEKVSFGTLQTWIEADSERSARVREARISQARYWDEAAESCISEASDPFELAKAKELAHHYRWRAAKIAPKQYGEKVAVGGADDMPAIKSVARIELVPLQGKE